MKSWSRITQRNFNMPNIVSISPGNEVIDWNSEQKTSTSKKKLLSGQLIFLL